MLTSLKAPTVQIKLSYCPDTQRLVIVNYITEFTVEQYKWASQYLPFNYADIKDFTEKAKAYFKVETVIQDLSFERFWEAYGLLENKKRTAQLWERLSKTDRFNAIRNIARYNAKLQVSGLAKKYPDTYLRTRDWET